MARHIIPAINPRITMNGPSFAFSGHRATPPRGCVNRWAKVIPTVRSLPEWRRRYFHLMMRRGRKIAKVAMARRLAVCLYWMLRQGWDYQQWVEFGRTWNSPDIAMVCSRTPSY